MSASKKKSILDINLISTSYEVFFFLLARKIAPLEEFSGVLKPNNRIDLHF